MPRTFVSAPVVAAAAAVAAPVAGTAATETEATTATAVATEEAAHPRGGPHLLITEEGAPDVTTDPDRGLTLLVSISSVLIKVDNLGQSKTH